jgi:integrase
MSQSSGSRRACKAADRPKKPYPKFPLTPHPCGKWCKKIRGQMHYFGQWATRQNGRLVRVEGDGAKESEEAYNAVRDDLHAGRTPRVQADGLTVGDLCNLCNRFLTSKLRKVEAEELTSRLFAEYKEVTDLLVKAFGSNRLVDDLVADDFAVLRSTMAKRWGPVRLGNSITRAKSVFKYGTDNGLIERAVHYGTEFKKPDKAVMRRHRAKSQPKMFEAEELRKLIDGATVEREEKSELVKPDLALRAMILLGINCGFGNTDCAALMFDDTDLDGGWIDFPRPKTGIARRCPLWPETVAALRSAIAVRPKPAGFPDCGRVFLTVRGNAFITHTAIEKTDDGKSTKGGFRKDLIGIQFGKLLDALDIHREGVGFYSLRHAFRTVADEARDQVAVDHIMGHTDGSMAAHYRERIDDSWLRAVVDHVRKWLWPGVTN